MSTGAVTPNTKTTPSPPTFEQKVSAIISKAKAFDTTLQNVQADTASILKQLIADGVVGGTEATASLNFLNIFQDVVTFL